MFRAQCAHRQEVKIVLYSLWYHHTETSEWSKITKITKIYKYEHILVKHKKRVTLSSTNNALPEDGVTAPKHVGALLM